MPMPYKKAHAISVALLFIGLAIITYFKSYWPSILLVVGIPLAIRQFLVGKHFDTWISIFVFVGLFFTIQFKISWDYLVPILFGIGGLYIFLRAFLGPTNVE